MAPNFRSNGRKNDIRNTASGNSANSIGRYIIRNGFQRSNQHANHQRQNSNNHLHPNKKQRFTSNSNSHHSQSNHQQRQQPNKQDPNQLPVLSYKASFFKLLAENQSLLVVGETGSGKTTQIPKWCLDFCLKKANQSCVACTQPRRIAAMSIAERVASEMDVPIGHSVGYSVRFESKTSDKTRLKYLTDGMLLREAMLDEGLKNYGIIILDEAHERTLQTEILFGVIKRAFNTRNSCTDKSLSPLKVVIMSATMNVKLFKSYFDSPVLHIHGRQHPVQHLYTDVHQSDLLISTLTCVFQVHRTCGDGDILVFCSGQDEIQTMITLTKRTLKQAPATLQNLTPLPLYASLPAVKQMEVFEKRSKVINTNGHTNGYATKNESTSDNSDGENHRVQSQTSMRRVIFSTNVAETSVTIPNIKYVIDTGKVKCRYYCPKTGLESLKVTNISKAQAKQRAGRAGRVAPGTCYHLYTNDDYSKLIEYLPPEIKRCNLDGVILQMISIGIKNISKFEFLERPDDPRLKAALVNLLNLKAIKHCHQEPNEIQGDIPADNKSEEKESFPKKKNIINPVTEDSSLLNLSYDLTALGKKLCAFPLDPALSRVILAAHELQCLDEALTVVSLLSIENLFYIPPNKHDQAERMLGKFYSNEGDVIMMLNVYRAFKRTLRLNKTGTKLWCVEHFIHLKNLRTAKMIRSQLADLCKGLNMGPSTCGQDTSLVRRALTFGLFNNVATMFDGKYRNKSNIEVFIHPSSCLFKAKPECILYVEVVESNKCYMRNCTLVDINWVREVSSSNIRLAN